MDKVIFPFRCLATSPIFISWQGPVSTFLISFKRKIKNSIKPKPLSSMLLKKPSAPLLAFYSLETEWKNLSSPFLAKLIKAISTITLSHFKKLLKIKATFSLRPHKSSFMDLCNLKLALQA
jgi:hypothetical protein